MKKVNQALIDRLVRQTQQGKTEAFGEIYDIYFQQIYKYVFYKVAEEHVEDLVSGVFVKAWTNINSYKKTKFPFQAWLFRIAHNAVIDHYRTNKEFYELEERLVDDNQSINPKHILEQQLTGERVQRALRQLEDKYHEVLQLKFMHDLSNREIADVLHTNEGNVRTLQFRGLKKLRGILEEEERAAELVLERKNRPVGMLKRFFARS